MLPCPKVVSRFWCNSALWQLSCQTTVPWWLNSLSIDGQYIRHIWCSDAQWLKSLVTCTCQTRSAFDLTCQKRHGAWNYEQNLRPLLKFPSPLPIIILPWKIWIDLGVAHMAPVVLVPAVNFFLYARHVHNNRSPWRWSFLGHVIDLIGSS